MGILSARSIIQWSTLAVASTGIISCQADGLDTFIQKQRDISLQNVLKNIGPIGSKVPGASAGVIVASPSTTSPDYFFTWTRDAALTMKMIVDEFMIGETQLESYIQDYIHSQAVLQTISNPSGTFLPNGAGLGEPKYQANLTRFNEAWGRPQRDGPALRAIALIAYSNWLVSNNQAKKAKTVVWPIISNDLSYTGQYWNQTTFDLWEEVQGSSFFTTQNQFRALVEGNTLAATLGEECTGCDQAAQVACFLQEAYWNGEFFVSNINDNSGRTGKDANSMLASIAVFDVNAKCDDNSIIQPCNSRALSSFKAFVDPFRDHSLYPINNGVPKSQGIAIGRYAEDVYFSGNPWYLITAGAAEFLYDAVAQWKTQSSLTIDDTSLPFFRDIYSAAAAKTYTPSDANSEFDSILNAITAYADSFMAVVQKYTPADGSLAEQFSKTSPFSPLSAADLTWSYAAFVTMAERRAGQYPPSWVPSTPLAVPSKCTPGSKTGVYTPAFAAGAPNVSTECTSNVRFQVNATTYFGENIKITGNTTDLGSWNLGTAWPLDAADYSDVRPIWSGTFALLAGESISYKYVRQENCGQNAIWESGDNRVLTAPACDPDADPSAVLLVTDDAWRGATGKDGRC
ncbi:family 15 glycosyl hydrolase [Xylaria nigripes]|nr:family 15 glycosyl hydrolase [Xylaria nigripes]